MPIATLPDRGVLEVAGADRVAFLQGLLSNDVAAAAPGRAVFAALLTPQGKWLADLFLFAEGERLLLDVEAAQLPALLQKLGRFRLRSQVALRDASADYAVQAGWGGAAMPAGVAAPDPRLAAAGWRALVAPGAAADATAEAYDRHRLALGLPDGSRDLVADQTLLLEAGHAELDGVSWTKGCYMGQELTARTRYRGLLKRRLVPVAVEGAVPPPGTPVLAEGSEAPVGEMRSGRDGIGIAQLRLEVLDGRALTAGGARVVPRIPGWMVLPQPAPA